MEKMNLDKISIPIIKLGNNKFYIKIDTRFS